MHDHNRSGVGELGSRALVFAAALLALACEVPPEPSAAPRGRRVRVVDEWGEPVAGAEVRIETGAPWDPILVETTETGADGWATVAQYAASPTRIDVRAMDPPRRHLAFGDFDPLQVAWRAAPHEPVVAGIQEAWVAGLSVPDGTRIAHSRRVSWGSFAPATALGDRARPWRARWPRAAWVAGFLNPGVQAEPTDVLVEIFGKRPTVLRVDMVRASQLMGPTEIDLDALASWPWVELPVVLRDPDGTPLGPAAQRIVRRGARLDRRDDLAWHESYALSADDPFASLLLPCGTFDLKLDFVQYPAEPSLGPFEITPDTTALDVTLPFALRDIELRLPGIGRDGYLLFAEHASGFHARWVGETGDAGRSIEIVLPPGPNPLRLEFWTDGGLGVRRATRVLDVGAEEPRVRTWDVGHAAPE